MERFQKYYLSLIFLAVYSQVSSQLNCSIFTDEQCRKACEISNQAANDQGYSLSQLAFDKVIEICPTYDDAYFEKSVPYLKRGDFVTWKELIDKAVALNPKLHLGYRGWCKYQFLRDYEGALADFETLEQYYPGNIGHSVNGDYDLYVAKAICYSALGQKQKAVDILENLFRKKDYHFGLFDYYQLGVTYFQLGNLDKALENFEKQSKIYDYAENIYYKGKIYKVKNKDYLDLKTLALQTYDQGKTIKDAYTHHFNKVYRKQIAEL